MKLFALLAITALSGLTAAADPEINLQQEFDQPPRSAMAQTWWHWSSNAVTRAGITADLEAMKTIGYSGAHLFFPSMSGMPPNHKWPEIMSDEWRENVKFAAGEAKRLGLEFGIHNCPGWSSSGGPWIKPEDSMQFLVSTAREVTGPQSGPLKLARPETRHDYYRDIAVYAFPVSQSMPQAGITTNLPAVNPAVLLDGSPDTFIDLPVKDQGTLASFTLEFSAPFAARFAEIKFDTRQLYINVEIEASDDGKNFRKIAAYHRGIHNDKCDPKLIAFNEDVVSAKFYRFNFIHADFPDWIKPRSIRLNAISVTAVPMIANIDRQNSSSDCFAYVPPSAKYAAVKGIDLNTMLDLTDKLKPDGTLDWSVPDGTWTILRIGHTPTGAMNAPASLRGLECDKLSRRGLDAHWPYLMDKILQDTSASGVLKYVTIDSYEVGGQNWTANFAAEFARRRGYSLQPYLPAALGYVVGTPADSARFLYDFQRTVSDLFAENYYDYFTELCHKNQLVALTEAYGGPYDQLRCARNADIPTGEFWCCLNMPSSSGHLYGKKRIGAEAFTTGPKEGRWQEDPRQLKNGGDRAWCAGINTLIMHSFVHQPYLNVRPGITLGPHGSHLNRHNTWWSYGADWIKYVNRSQALLQAGQPVADLLILAGESAPNGVAYLNNVSAAGYCYDYCGSDDLKEAIKVKNGKIQAPSGVTYEVLSLGTDRYLSLATLRKTAALLENGATVAGLPPLGSPSLADRSADPAYRELVMQLWGSNPKSGSILKVGQGRLIVTSDPVLALKAAAITPDLAGAGINFVHRRAGADEIYFVCNNTDSYFCGEIKFRVADGKAPELWYPDTGKTGAAAIWRSDVPGVVTIPLPLAPRESLFVVFRPGSAVPAFKRFVTDEPAVKLDITRAVYRAIGETAGADVTSQIKQLVGPGGLDFIVDNRLVSQDPAPNRIKELVLDYAQNGQTVHKVIQERERAVVNTSLRDHDQGAMPVRRDNELLVCFERNGQVSVELADGSVRNVKMDSMPAPLELNEAWRLTFPPDMGTPAVIELPQLISWTDYPDNGVKYFSGTAAYSKEFVLPERLTGADRRTILDLGSVKNLAEVELNGQKVALLWKLPFAVDVTGFLQPGKNRLVIRVTNLWVNRLIGDEQRTIKDEEINGWPKWVLADLPNSGTGRYTFSSWKGWGKDDLPFPSGLLGPVVLRAAELVKVK